MAAPAAPTLLCSIHAGGRSPPAAPGCFL